MTFPTLLLWTLAGAAFPLTVAILLLLLRQQAHLPVDLPNERSLHSRPIPRVGGLGLMPSALVLGTCIAMDDGAILAALAGALFLLLLSVFDDYLNLPALPRLLGHLIVAFGMTLWLGFPVAIGLVLALGVTWITNLYNFMDGANGLAGGMSAIGFAAYAAAAWLGGDIALAAVSATLVTASLAFLCFNFGNAHLFLGDAGSVPLGFLAGALGLIGFSRDLWPLWFPLAVFSVFIVDATTTLMRRLARGEKVWQAHRQHAYQRLIRNGWSHSRLALHAYSLMAASALLGLVLIHVDVTIQWLGGIALLAAYCLILFLIEKRALGQDAKNT